MKTLRSALAAAEVLLVLPAALFMTALFVRNIQPQQYEPAHTAQQIVNWYAARPRLGLWVLLIALPLTVVFTGGVTLFRRWRSDAGFREAVQQIVLASQAHVAMLLVAVATLMAGGILAVVAVHVLTN